MARFDPNGFLVIVGTIPGSNGINPLVYNQLVYRFSQKPKSRGASTDCRLDLYKQVSTGRRLTTDRANPNSGLLIGL